MAHLGSLLCALGACATSEPDGNAGSGDQSDSDAMVMEAGTGGVGGQAGGGTGGTTGGSGGTGVVPGPLPEGDPDPQQCADVTRKNYQACVVDRWGDPDAGTQDDDRRLRYVDLTGTVEAIEPGIECEGIGSASMFTASGYGVRVMTPGGEGLTLGLAVPWEAPLFAAGDIIDVSFHRDPEPWLSEGGPPAGSVEVRNAEGQLLYWMAEMHYMLNFVAAPPELTITNGEVGCWFETTGCKEAVVRGGLRVDAGGASVNVPFGEMRNVGDYVVVVADNEEHRYTGAICGAGPRQSVIALAVRGSLEALNAQP